MKMHFVMTETLDAAYERLEELKCNVDEGVVEAIRISSEIELALADIVGAGELAKEKLEKEDRY